MPADRQSDKGDMGLVSSILLVLIGFYLVCAEHGRCSTVKKGAYSKMIVVAVILLNIMFTAAVLYVFLRTTSEPSTLVGCWFGFTTGELWLLASIKRRSTEGSSNGD